LGVASASPRINQRMDAPLDDRRDVVPAVGVSSRMLGD
jgi:hypothetical protein